MFLGVQGGCALAFEFLGEHLELGFERGDAVVEGGFGEGGGWLVDEVIDGDAGEFGEGADAVGEADVAEPFVFVDGETEGDHAVTGGEGRRRGHGVSYSLLN